MTAPLVLVGGGLANTLVALRILTDHPDFPLLMLERATSLGEGHTWSFHDSDLTARQRAWLDPLVAHSWDHHELRFPGRRRTLTNRYNSVTPDRLQAVASRSLGDRLRLGVTVTDLGPDHVRLDDGTRIAAAAVLDGRGDPGGRHLDVAYQKFVGLFLRLGRPHGLDGPILMDATVSQRDGYRFVYTLPLAADTLLVEDTYYSDGPTLDRAAIAAEIRDYAADHGWELASVEAEESGVLPIALGGDLEAFWNDGPAGVARSGMRGAFFHPTTGYTLPEAVGLADAIAAQPRLDGPALHALTRQRSRRLWQRTGYYRLLNRMLFRAAVPERRYRVFERFYGLSEGLIQRFYAGRLTWRDRIRLVTGKPPVPVLRAVPCLFERRRPSTDHGEPTSGGAT
jgi:lycopene beta-cyclase